MQLVKVSLREVPLSVRRRAARPLIDRLEGEGGITALRERVELEMAVSFPSERRYRVSADAAARVLR